MDIRPRSLPPQESRPRPVPALMSRSLVCTACGAVTQAADGYLRPEGFLCNACYQTKCATPEYRAEQERQLFGLASAASQLGTSRAATPPIARPVSPRDRLAYESLLGLSIGDALG